MSAQPALTNAVKSVLLGHRWLRDALLSVMTNVYSAKGTAALRRSFCHRAKKSPSRAGTEQAPLYGVNQTPLLYYSDSVGTIRVLFCTLYHQLPSCAVRSAIIGIKRSIWRRGAGLVTRTHPIQSQIAPPQVPSSTEDREVTNMGWLTQAPTRS